MRWGLHWRCKLHWAIRPLHRQCCSELWTRRNALAFCSDKPLKHLSPILFCWRFRGTTTTSRRHFSGISQECKERIVGAENLFLSRLLHWRNGKQARVLCIFRFLHFQHLHMHGFASRIPSGYSNEWHPGIAVMFQLGMQLSTLHHTIPEIYVTRRQKKRFCFLFFCKNEEVVSWRNIYVSSEKHHSYKIHFLLNPDPKFWINKLPVWTVNHDVFMLHTLLPPVISTGKALSLQALFCAYQSQNRKTPFFTYYDRWGRKKFEKVDLRRK